MCAQIRVFASQLDGISRQNIVWNAWHLYIYLFFFLSRRVFFDFIVARKKMFWFFFVFFFVLLHQLQIIIDFELNLKATRLIELNRILNAKHPTQTLTFWCAIYVCRFVSVFPIKFRVKWFSWFKQHQFWSFKWIYAPPGFYLTKHDSLAEQERISKRERDSKKKKINIGIIAPSMWICFWYS